LGLLRVRWTRNAADRFRHSTARSAGSAGSTAEARLAISRGQIFYAYARVAKPGSAELNVVTPAPALGQDVA